MKELIETRKITKDFPGVRALDGIDFTVRGGEVLGLVGENGAGKSTLMRILGGVYPHGTYGGQLLVGGQEVRFGSPLDAEKAGIAIIHQELSTFPHLTVGENMFVGHLPRKGGLVDWDHVYAEADRWLQTVGARCSSKDLMGSLSVGTQQLVEIAKALSRQSNVVILDEPTSALSDNECAILFDLIKKLRTEGKGLVYISHKMDEIYKLCDRIVVLRDGRSVHSDLAKSLDERALISHMVGRSVTNLFPDMPESRCIGEVMLSVKGLSATNVEGKKVLTEVGLQVRSGEILGLAGLLGAGRSEIFRALFGDRQIAVIGEIIINGFKGKPSSPRKALRRGLVMVPEDRKRQSIFPQRSLNENVAQTRLALRRLFSIIKGAEESALNEESRKRLRVKTTSMDRAIKTLSGGNQQKVVLGRVLQVKPQIILLDEPTRGVDVGAKYEIYEILFSLAASGHALVVVSSELPELLGICDRVAVLSHGRLTATFEKTKFDPKEIMRFAVGAV